MWINTQPLEMSPDQQEAEMTSAEMAHFLKHSAPV